MLEIKIKEWLLEYAFDISWINNLIIKFYNNFDHISRDIFGNWQMRHLLFDRNTKNHWKAYPKNDIDSISSETSNKIELKYSKPSNNDLFSGA